nr:unnamed protein product [Callosobruchus analis]
MEQVLFIPTLIHSQMFYSRQLSCYNLGVHMSDNGNAYMCLWNESLTGRGGNEVASAYRNNKKQIRMQNERLVRRMHEDTPPFLEEERELATSENNYRISGRRDAQEIGRKEPPK